MEQISKSNVVDDMVESNQVLYKDGEKPDHCVVIKYVPYVGTVYTIIHYLLVSVIQTTFDVCR